MHICSKGTCKSGLTDLLTDWVGLRAGRIQATLVLAVVYQELHRHMSLREPSAQDTVRDDSPSLIIGNPLYTEAATLSTYASSSAKAQPVPDEASLSTDQPPTNTLFTENELCDSLPLAIADELHNPSSSSPDLPDSAQPLVISTHVTSDSVTSPGPQGVPREPSPTPHLSAPQNLRAMMVSVPHHRDPSVPAADPGSPVDFNSADTQMGWGGQTIQDDTHHDSQAPTHPDNSESFGSFLFHDMSNNQSASDRSDSRDSFTSTSASSPRSTLPALQCPVQKLPLLSNRNPVSDVNLAHSPVPDTSSRALQKSSQTTSMHSPQTAQTQALTTQTSARSNRRKPRQVIHSLSICPGSDICIWMHRLNRFALSVADRQHCSIVVCMVAVNIHLCHVLLASSGSRNSASAFSSIHGMLPHHLLYPDSIEQAVHHPCTVPELLVPIVGSWMLSINKLYSCANSKYTAMHSH